MIPFNDQPTLDSADYRMRPLEVNDHAALFAAASDPAIWAVHPASDRWQADVFRPYFDFLLRAGGTLVLIDRSTEQVIGCSRYYATPDVADSISIGFTFVARAYWGGATNRAMKTLMLDHAFQSFDAVWLHIGMDNIRSQKATMKIGAKFMYDAPIDVGSGDAPMKCYRLSREDWQARP